MKLYDGSTWISLGYILLMNPLFHISLWKSSHNHVPHLIESMANLYVLALIGLLISHHALQCWYILLLISQFLSIVSLKFWMFLSSTKCEFF